MSGYIGTQPVPQATQTRDSFTATSGQTSFATGGYTPNFLDVYLNGVKLASADYTATNGSDVVLASGASTGDILEVVAYTAFDTANVTGATDFTVTGAFTSQGIDDNANATAMTIDSSENVLVGQTTANSNAVGTSLRSDGRNFYCADGNYSAHFNRKSSDGAIAHFAKDDTIVGSIGTSGNQSYIHGAGTDVGIYFGSNNLYPYRSTGLNDATIDIGQSAKRFKDAYLSGGIYLGGVGSANYLDDYEEGSFTPTLHGGFSSGPTSYSPQIGVYVKVGKLVSFQIDIKAIGASANGSLIQLGGLPFTSVQNATNGYGAAYISYQESFVFGNYPQLHVAADSTVIQFYQNGSGSAVAYNGNASDTNINARLIIVGQYLTDA